MMNTSIHRFLARSFLALGLLGMLNNQLVSQNHEHESKRMILEAVEHAIKHAVANPFANPYFVYTS